MPQKTNLNVPPYNDDFDVKKNFYKVLIRPGYAIQARELTTLQTILQNQIESFGKNIFKQGDMVVPGQVALNTQLDYVKLSSVSEVAVNVDGNIVFQKYDIKNLIGLPLTGTTSNVTGVVIAAEYGTEFEADTLFVKYVSSGSSSDEKTFRQGETLEADIANSPTLVVGTDGSVLPTTITRVDGETGLTLPKIGSNAMGYGSAVSVEEGVYFINGYFVRNDKSLIILDRYYNKPTCKVGFLISEEIITPEEDSTLYDNAAGFSNYAAPGAHRLKINLDLVVYDYDQVTGDNFIKLISVKNGVVEKILKPAEYNTIEETLARRTYDESGDYVVDNFSVDLREWYQNGDNKGLYPENSDGTVGPDGQKFSKSDALNKVAVGIAPGKAYVKGYEIVNKETKYYPLDKARDLVGKPDNRIKITNLPSFNVTNVYGSIPLNNEGSSLTAYPSVYLCNTFGDGSLGFNGTEDATDTIFKQTIDRRNKSSFTLDQGIKTIYVKLRGGESLPSQTAFGNTFTTLWYIKSRGDSGEQKSVDLISYKKVTRSDLNLTETILELTVVGDKYDLVELFKDYDDGDTRTDTGIKRKKLFATKADAAADTTAYYGYIIDYNETITPVIGITKPKNFTFLKNGIGFNADTDKILSKGSLSTGTRLYNGIFSFSHFNPVFFTKIVLEAKIKTGFTSGQYITGLESGAFGVIENSNNGQYSLTTSNLLYVRTLSGTFLSGESLVDESGNSARIAKENTISHFIVLNRGLSYPADNVTISVNGTKIDKSAVLTYVDTASTGINQVYKIDIINRNLFNTEYLYPPTVAVTYASATPPSTFGSGAIVVPVLFRNTVVTYNQQDVKSLYSTYNSYKFSADVDYSTNSYYSSKSITNFSFVGLSGQTYLECSGFAGDATTDLKQGDIVQFTDTSNNVIRSIVQSSTKPQGLLKSRIYLDSTLTNNVNGSIIKVFSKVENAQSNLLVPTGSKYVQSIVKDITNSTLSYYIRRDFVISTSNTGGNANITFVAELGLGTQRFVPYTQDNFIVTVLSDGGSSEVDAGDILYIKPEWVSITNTTQTSGLTSGTFTLNIPSTFFGTVSDFTSLKLKLSATLEVDKAVHRIKTLKQNKKITVTSSSDKVILLRGQDYVTQSQDILSYSDAIKINFVYEGSLTTTPVFDDAGNLVTGLDVTERFSFDDGQRDTFYDVSRLILKPGYTAPSGILVISFDYFEHSQGDFCTVDSYLHESGVNIGDIPYFNSTSLGRISLRDVIDFRPKIDTTSVISGYQNQSILGLSDYCSFVGTGGVVTNTPATDSNLEYTIKFDLYQYLDRIDSLTLNKKGEFSVNYGNSSLNPVKPEDVKDAITLYYLYVPSYTNDISDIKVVPVDNKRYTMKDIGKLEKRIERLEYYTQLSILEQQALNMQVKDDIGLDRLKTGFLVDNFENHSVGNLQSIDYKCAIDSQQSVLRPPSFEDSIDLQELYKTDEERTANNYKNNNGVITLPYSELVFSQNTYGTTIINPNPFDVSKGQYVGDAYLSPSIDQWYDRKEFPVILNNDSSVYSIFFAKSLAPEAFNSIYNSYLINWLGTNRTFFNVNSLANLSSVTSSASITNASVSSSSNISPQNNELARGASSATISGNSVVTALNFYVKTKIVQFKVNRMKPNTKLYTFIDGINVDRWIIPDSKYTGVAGNSLTSFGSSIITDSDGNASGFLLIPSGYPPLLSSAWFGDPKLLSYDSSYKQCHLTTGIKTIRFTSSSTDDRSSSTASYSETKYYATGILPPLPSSIVSTSPAFFKADEGIQFVESSASQPSPLTQTFKVENSEGGIFVTGIDLFFNQKSSNLPIRVYLTNVDSGKPGKYILPGSESIKLPNSYIKVYTNGTVTLTIGEIVTGTNSGASGPLASVRDKNNGELTVSSDGKVILQNNQVYTLVLSNNNGKTFVETELLIIPSLVLYNNTQTTFANALKVTVAKSSGRINSLKLKSFGQNYETATLVIESPSLVGGSTATGSALVSNGKLYQVDLSLGGSGYTQIPSVIVNGTGNGASGAEIEAELIIDTPAVVMGVAVDPGTTGVIDSSTSTRFNFQYPVYLQNNTEYAFVVETDSNQYQLWSSQLGKLDKITNTTVTTQPLLGSVFRSQNVDNWSEDLSEDIKFTLYKAKFDTTTKGTVYLTNKDLGYELLNVNPFETNTSQDSTASSLLFKNNNKIIKVYHPNHGFEESGKSIVNMKRCDSSGGVSADVLNGNYFTISNAGTNTYTINCGADAGTSTMGGGSKVLISYNRKFEKSYPLVPCLNFSSTTVTSSVKTTNIIPHDNSTNVYQSYNQSDFETTFLNEEQYFTNQKVICSTINEINNSIDSSVVYKIEVGSTNPNLSPVIDSRFASLKIVNNLVERSSGKENRFGRKDQIIKFYPIYKFTVANLVLPGGSGAYTPALNQTVSGSLSRASGTIIKWDASTGKLYVKVKTGNTFQANDVLTFSNSNTPTTAYITSNGVELYQPNFVVGTTVTALSTVNVPYTNLISGKIISWDYQNATLILSNNKNPINNNYTSNSSNSPYARTTNNQVADIFRVGDVLTYQGIVNGEERFVEISSVDYTNGVDYVPETLSSNSSSLAKYVTKEIVLQSPSTSIDVRLSLNCFGVDDVLVFYKIKLSNTQTNFDDLNWYPFNSYGESDTQIIPSADNSISGLYENQSAYKEYKYSTSGLKEFTSYAIKIVMRTSNPCFVPKIQDMRAVASY